MNNFANTPKTCSSRESLPYKYSFFIREWSINHAHRKNFKVEFNTYGGPLE